MTILISIGSTEINIYLLNLYSLLHKWLDFIDRKIKFSVCYKGTLTCFLWEYKFCD